MTIGVRSAVLGGLGAMGFAVAMCGGCSGGGGNSGSGDGGSDAAAGGGGDSAGAVGAGTDGAATDSGTGAPDAAATTAGGIVGTGASKMADIGPAGGSIALEGLTLTVPAGALAQSTNITLTSSKDGPPAGYTNLSPLYKLTPDGLAFAKPATLTVAMAPSQGGVNMFAADTEPKAFGSNASGGYDALPGALMGDSISTEISHFSSYFLGAKAMPTGPKFVPMDELAVQCSSNATVDPMSPNWGNTLNITVADVAYFKDAMKLPADSQAIKSNSNTLALFIATASGDKPAPVGKGLYAVNPADGNAIKGPTVGAQYSHWDSKCMDTICTASDKMACVGRRGWIAVTDITSFNVNITFDITFYGRGRLLGMLSVPLQQIDCPFPPKVVRSNPVCL